MSSFHRKNEEKKIINSDSENVKSFWFGMLEKGKKVDRLDGLSSHK